LTRRRVPDSELVYPDAAENERVKNVVDILSRKRLIVEGSSENPKGEAESYVEPAHDALIVAWDKLLKWRADEEEAMLLQRQLTRAAMDWEGSSGKKEKKGLLWDNNPRLVRAQEILQEKRFCSLRAEKKQGLFVWLKQFWRVLCPSFEDIEQTVWLNRVETAFVRRSIERKRNWTCGVTGIVMVVIVSLVTGWWYTSVQKNIAVNERIKADKQREQAEKNLRRVEAIQLATESAAISSNTEKLFYSWSASGGANNEIEAPSFTKPLRLARESVLSTLEKDKYVNRESFDALRQAVGSAPPWKGIIPIGVGTGKNDIITPSAIAWSPDGNFLTAVSQAGDVVVWDLNENNTEIGRTRVQSDEEWLWSNEWLISWCGNTHFLVSGAANTVQLFDIHSIKTPVIISKEPETIAACNSSGTQVVLRKKDNLLLAQRNNLEWKHIATVTQDANKFSFSQDDKHLSFISKDGLHIQSLVDAKEKYSFLLNAGEQFLHAEWSSVKNDLRLFVIKAKGCGSEEQNNHHQGAEVDFFYHQKRTLWVHQEPDE
ncbi:MAG: WD40 repeat domain-containing protein, partial [Candidatus Electrothrix sp. AX5]|nr:WD40 repeat domain-containing protein [Candidatus Electrothrix sp. AX5]